MEKLIKHKFLNSVLFTALFVPLGFFLLRDTIAAITGIMFESIGGKESLLYQINDDIARLIIVGLLMLIMPIFFRGKCNFGFRGGKLKLGILLALPELIVPLWNFLQIKIYDAPFVVGTTAVIAAIVHGVGPGVSEEIFCRGFVVSNLMRIWKDKPKKFTRCMLVSGIAFGLLHAVNAIATGDIFAALVQVIYTAAIGVFDGAIFLRTRNIWGVILMHTLTDISAFIAVFDESIHVTGMDIVFCIFGSLVFIALAFYLIRPAKRAEMEALWADGWSFGNENGKTRAGAKAAVVISTAVVIAFVASLGVTIYQVKMGYDVPIFSTFEKKLDSDIQYQISENGKELTISLPHTAGASYNVKSSDPESFVLKERQENGDTYLFVFDHNGASTEKVKITFGLRFGDMSTSIKNYSVSVSFKDDGSISAVGG